MQKQYIKRHIEKSIYLLLNNFPVIVVAGARQVGKSTMLKQLFPNYKHIVFDPLIDVEGVKNDPELFLRMNNNPLILDEIQYVPSLIPAIKRVVDANRKNGQFLITGSQQWEVLKNLKESLAGRVAFLDLYPFSQAETKKHYDSLWLLKLLETGINGISALSYEKSNYSIFEQIWRGYYPETNFMDKEAIPYFFQGYERTYIERDIRLILEKNNMDQFVRFYRLCAAMTAQEINYSQIGRELGISPDTSRRWLMLLKATYQWLEIPAFSRNAIKRLSKKGKGYIVDSGICCHALGISSPQVLPSYPGWGHIFESAVVMDIIKQIQAVAVKPNIYHYRTLAGAEVDLILEYNGKYYPIEIKGKSNPSKKDTLGIRSFIDAYPDLSIGFGLIISAGDKIYPLTDTVWVVPYECILKNK